MAHIGDLVAKTLARDERSTGYAADPYACLTGRSGVCDVTVGPPSSASCLATGRLYATWESPRRASTIGTETSEEEFPNPNGALCVKHKTLSHLWLKGERHLNDCYR